MKITITEITPEEFKELGTFLKNTFPSLEIELLNEETDESWLEKRHRMNLFYKKEWGLPTRVANALVCRYKYGRNGEIIDIDSPSKILSLADEQLRGRNFGPSSLQQLREAIAGKSKEELLANLGQYGLTE